MDKKEAEKEAYLILKQNEMQLRNLLQSNPSFISGFRGYV